MHIRNPSKHFKIFNRREGLDDAFYPSPLIGIGLFAITYWIWTQGVNSYTGIGS